MHFTPGLGTLIGDTAAVPPEPLLTAASDVSATFVAILGGLLVANLLNLFAQRGSTEQLLSDARARLGTAQQRAEKAAEDRREHEAGTWLNFAPIAREIIGGQTRVDRLLQTDDDVELTPAELATYVHDAAGEANAARTKIEKTLDYGKLDLAVEEWEALDDWDRFWPQILKTPPLWLHREIWQQTLAQVVAERIAQREADTSADAGGLVPDDELKKLFPGHIFDVATVSSQPWVPPDIKFSGNGGRRSELRTTAERAQQQAEDLEAEVSRLKSAHDGLARPHWQIWAGLAILLLCTITGVIAPMLALAKIWSISTAGILLGLLLAVGLPTIFMIVLATGLNRTKASAG